jgi:Na+/proline symporter
MSRLTVRCIKAACVYLVLGVGLGASFALNRTLGAVLRPLHAEFNLWGWVTLLIYGMAYHMLPRFMGRPLRWSRLATTQSWLAICGVGLAAWGWIGLAMTLPAAPIMLVGGGVLQASAALLFVVLIGDLLLHSPGDR